MTKKIFVMLLALMTSAFAFTGCSDEEPFSFYQIGVYFPESTTIEAKPEDQRTEQEKQDLIAMQTVLKYLLNNQYVKTHIYNGAVYFMGADEEHNDDQARRYYMAKKAELDELSSSGDLDKILSDEKAKLDTELTGSGSFIFTYSMTKGSVASNMTGCTASYSVTY